MTSERNPSDGATALGKLFLENQLSRFSYADHWQQLDVHLQRVKTVRRNASVIFIVHRSILATEQWSRLFDSRWKGCAIHQDFSSSVCDENQGGRCSCAIGGFAVGGKKYQRTRKMLSFSLSLRDIILSVNEVDFTNINHQAAVDALKTAGPHVHLVRR